MKVRLIERYSPFSGTWYVLKVKWFLFWWRLPKVYTDAVVAKQAMYDLNTMFANDVIESVISEKEVEI